MADPRAVDCRNPGRVRTARLRGISVWCSQSQSVVVDGIDANHLSGIGSGVGNCGLDCAVSVHVLAPQRDAGCSLRPVAVTLPVEFADYRGFTGDAGIGPHGL